jgi:hypothetical protein
MNGHEGDTPAAGDPPPLRSVHTTNLPQLLAEARASVLVTTYQAGKLVMLRNHAGVLNTHFRNFAKQMGLAIERGKLAIGTHVEIAEFHNVPAVCPKLDERSDKADAATKHAATDRFRHDACFLPIPGKQSPLCGSRRRCRKSSRSRF